MKVSFQLNTNKSLTQVMTFSFTTWKWDLSLDLCMLPWTFNIKEREYNSKSCVCVTFKGRWDSFRFGKIFKNLNGDLHQASSVSCHRFPLLKVGSSCHTHASNSELAWKLPNKWLLLLSWKEKNLLFFDLKPYSFIMVWKKINLAKILYAVCWSLSCSVFCVL